MIFFPSAVHAAGFLTDGYRILTCSDDQTSVLWDLASGQILTSFHEHQVSERNKRCNDNGAYLIQNRLLFLLAKSQGWATTCARVISQFQKLLSICCL